PDYYALNLANLLFGRIGLYGRLGRNLRDEQGLAYYAFTGLDARTAGGIWSISAGVNPANLEKAAQSIRAELDRLQADPFRTDATLPVTDDAPLRREARRPGAPVLRPYTTSFRVRVPRSPGERDPRGPETCSRRPWLRCQSRRTQGCPAPGGGGPRGLPGGCRVATGISPRSRSS